MLKMCEKNESFEFVALVSAFTRATIRNFHYYCFYKSFIIETNAHSYIFIVSFCLQTFILKNALFTTFSLLKMKISEMNKKYRNV